MLSAEANVQHNHSSLKPPGPISPLGSPSLDADASSHESILPEGPLPGEVPKTALGSG